MNINNIGWKQVHEPEYTVKDALMHGEHISINVRAAGSSEDNILTNNGELCMVLS